MVVSALDQDNAPVVLACGQVPAAQGNLVASAEEVHILAIQAQPAWMAVQGHPLHQGHLVGDPRAICNHGQQYQKDQSCQPKENG